MENPFDELAKALSGCPRRLSRRLKWVRARPPAALPPFDFDALARDMAGGLSRRQVLGRLAGGLAGGVLTALGLTSAASAAAPCPPRPDPLRQRLHRSEH